MPLRLLNTSPPPQRAANGRIRSVSWDNGAWTLVVQLVTGERRLLQIPPYASLPKPGQPIRLVGRHPVRQIYIAGVLALSTYSSNS